MNAKIKSLMKKLGKIVIKKPKTEKEEAKCKESASKTKSK